MQTTNTKNKAQRTQSDYNQEKKKNLKDKVYSANYDFRADS